MTFWSIFNSILNEKNAKFLIWKMHFWAPPPKIVKFSILSEFWKINCRKFSKFWRLRSREECKSCRSRKMLQNASLLAIVAVDTEENEPIKNEVWWVRRHFLGARIPTFSPNYLLANFERPTLRATEYRIIFESAEERLYRRRFRKTLVRTKYNSL